MTRIYGNSKVIVEFKNNAYGKKFFIFNNYLIFSDDNVAYYSDLDGLNRTKIVDGEIVYIDNKIYIVKYFRINKDELRLTTYDNKSFRATNKYSANLATGNSIKLLKREDDLLYFNCYDSNNNVSLFEVDINNSRVNVLFTTSTESNISGVINDYTNIIKRNNNYYYILSEKSEITEGNGPIKNNLYSSPVGSHYSELVRINVGKYLIKYPKNKDNIIFQSYDNDVEEFVWKNIGEEDVSYNWREFLYGDITSLFKIEESTLYVDNEKVADFDFDLSGYAVNKAVRLDDGYYFLLSNDDNHSWYFCGLFGQGLTKIY